MFLSEPSAPGEKGVRAFFLLIALSAGFALSVSVSQIGTVDASEGLLRFAGQGLMVDPMAAVTGNAAGELSRFETPIVLMVFNRPELTRRVFDRIAEVRPERLLVIADGPRTDRAGEAERVAAVRRIVGGVDWPCEVLTNFSENNLGCRARVISGLNWAFEQVEEAIILEDDILPDLSFFPFCAEMLRRFRGDQRVSMVTGFNVGADLAQTPYSYYFSTLTHIWGWATWRQAWQHYDEHMSTWPAVRDSGLLRGAMPDAAVRRYWTPILEGMYQGTGPNTWDYQWMFTNLTRRTLAVSPKVNLVENIGFGADATHETDAKGAPKVSVGSVRFPLHHPPTMMEARELDALDERLSDWFVPGLPTRARRKLKRMVRRRLPAAS